MKSPVLTRFQKQNYSGAPDWFGRFLDDLNSFTETTWNTLNKNMTISDNIDMQVFQTTILAGATPAANAFLFTPTVKHTPLGVKVVSVQDQSAYSAPPTAAVDCSWTFDGSQISIRSVTGLTSGHTYSISLLVI